MNPKVIVVREKEVKERVVYRDRPAKPSEPYKLTWWDEVIAHYAGICAVFVPILLFIWVLWSLEVIKR